MPIQNTGSVCNYLNHSVLTNQLANYQIVRSSSLIMNFALFYRMGSATENEGREFMIHSSKGSLKRIRIRGTSKKRESTNADK